MLNPSVTQGTLSPLILRLALAIILLYHGSDKVTTREHDWGANWAVGMYGTQKPPAGVMERIDEMSGYTAEDKEEMKESLRAAYAQQKEELPDAVRIVAAQIAVAWGELLLGAAMILGLFTRVSALLVIVIQVGAIWTVTAAKGFSSLQGTGYEYNLILIAICVSLLLTGAGKCSVDRLLLATHKEVQAPAPAVAA